MVLGDMPESLYRMTIGAGFKLSHIKKVFAHLLEVGRGVKKSDQLKWVNLKYLAYKEIPDIFIHARDPYLASYLLNASLDSPVLAYIGKPHLASVASLLSDLSERPSFNIQSFIGVPGDKEPPEHQVEKQAILEVILET